LSPQLPTPPGAESTPEAQVRAIVASLNAVDVTKLSNSAQIALFAERRRAAEALGRVAGPAPTRVMTWPEFMQVNDGMVGRVFASIFEHLEGHPAIREAILADIKKFEKEVA
jgi:hypothetical protein